MKIFLERSYKQIQKKENLMIFSSDELCSAISSLKSRQGKKTVGSKLVDATG